MKSDLQLQQDVAAELAWEPSIDARYIAVGVDSGVVTLSGHVISLAEKIAVENATKRVAGVKALAIEMDVKIPSSQKRSDAEVAKLVENMLMWTSNIPINFIDIQVEQGWVILSGDVDWDYQRRAAEDAIRVLIGVSGISNDIVVRPKVPSDNLKLDIEHALKRLASTEAKRIMVDIKGAEVTLSGSVESWAEAERASQTAWRAPGVKNVINNMLCSF